MRHPQQKAKRHEPILGPAEQENPDGSPAFSLTNAASATECTGLIPVPPSNEEELEHYAQVFRYAQTEPLPPKP